MRLLLIRHWSGTDIASILELAAARGIEVDICEPKIGQELPNCRDFDVVICMGGPQSAVGEVEDYLLAEMEYLRKAIRENQPILGICLGSQLLARALGGTAIVGPQGLEAGYIDVLPAGRAPGTVDVAGRYFSFHTDSFELPPGATLLAASDRYPQAWSFGSALALQFHPEISPEGVNRLLDAEARKIGAAGTVMTAIRAEATASANKMSLASEALIGGWLDVHCRPQVPAN